MKFKTLSLVASALALSVSAPAFAGGSNQQQPTPTTTSTTTPPPAETPCGGNACVTQWTVGGTALFGGAGASMFEGTEGFNLIEKTGSGGVDMTVNAGGGLCGVTCSDGEFTFSGFAKETVAVSTGAFGDVSGSAVQAQNMGQAAGAVNFSLSKNFSSPAPAPSGN